MLLVVHAAPQAEPVSTAEVKAHLHVLHGNEDTTIERFARAARSHVETTLGRALVTQTLRLFLPAFPAGRTIELPRPPLLAVGSVTYADFAGNPQTLGPDAYEVVTEDKMAGWIELKPDRAWPATLATAKAVTIEFTAGFGAQGDSVPEEIRNALLMLTEHFYFNRGATAEQRVETVPMAVDALLAPWRTFGWI